MKNNNGILKYWKKEHLEYVKNAKSFPDLTEIALDILHSMPQPIGEVCGPISTGGNGSIKENVEIFKKIITKLVGLELNIFNQLLWGDTLKRFVQESSLSRQDANKMILKNLYLPIFKSGLVKNLYFMDNWNSSYGASWERERAKELSIKMIDLPYNFLDISNKEAKSFLIKASSL